MTATIVEAVRARTDPLCQTSVCCDSGCCMSMQGVPEPYVLINLEHETAPRHPGHSRHRNHPHCDFLLVAGNDDENGGPWVAPIELTTGNKDGDILLRQLRAGADIADEILPPNIAFRFKPVFAHDGRLHRYVINEVITKESNYIECRVRQSRLS